MATKSSKFSFTSTKNSPDHTLKRKTSTLTLPYQTGSPTFPQTFLFVSLCLSVSVSLSPKLLDLSLIPWSASLLIPSTTTTTGGGSFFSLWPTHSLYLSISLKHRLKWLKLILSKLGSLSLSLSLSLSNEWVSCFHLSISQLGGGDRWWCFPMVGLLVVIFVNLGLWRIGVVILWQICRFMGCDSEVLVREWWDLENSGDRWVSK